MIQKDVGEKQRSTGRKLPPREGASSIVELAMAALDLGRLDPQVAHGECKGMMACSPGGVDDVFAASMVLLAGIYPNIQHKKLKVKDRSWDAAKKCLGSAPKEIKNQVGNIKEYIEYLAAKRDIKIRVDALDARFICADEGRSGL